MASDYFSQFPRSDNTGVTGGMLGPAVPATGQTPSTSMGLAPSYAAGPSQGAGGGDYQSEFLQAAQELGISPQQFRSNPEVMNRVTDYLNQKYPGQNWSNGGQRAGDWVGVNGQGFDVLPAGDANWQWLNDPANSTAGSGGGLNYGAVGNLGDLLQGGGDPMSVLANTPGYQWMRDEAENAVQRGAAAKGTLLTGGLQKDLAKYIAGAVAGPAYQQRYQNLFGLAGLGENAAALTGNAGSSYAGAAGNLLTGIGNAQAANSIAGANAWGNALNGIGQNVLTGIYANQNKYNANQSGYNPNGVNGYGVSIINPDPVERAFSPGL